MRRPNPAIWLLLLGLCLGALSAQAANIQGPKRSVLDKLKDEDAVRNRTLYRKGRISVAPALSMTLNDAYRRNVLVGFDGIYNISDEIGVGLGGFFGLAYNTSLADQLETKRKDAVEEGAAVAASPARLLEAKRAALAVLREQAPPRARPHTAQAARRVGKE